MWVAWGKAPRHPTQPSHSCEDIVRGGVGPIVSGLKEGRPLSNGSCVPLRCVRVRMLLPQWHGERPMSLSQRDFDTFRKYADNTKIPVDLRVALMRALAHRPPPPIPRRPAPVVTRAYPASTG